jgi:hypothetical protein
MSAGHHFAVQYARGGLPPCVRRRVHDYIAAHLDQKITNDALAQTAHYRPLISARSSSRLRACRHTAMCCNIECGEHSNF